MGRSGIAWRFTGGCIVFCIIAIPFFVKSRTIQTKCVTKTIGKVVKHKRGGSKRSTWISPLVEFCVDGKKYYAYRHYKGTLLKITNEPVIDSETGKYMQCYVDDKDMFHRQICRNVSVEKKSVEEIWPIGSEMIVFYNSQKPKQAFVDKVVSTSNIAGIVFLSCGVVFIAMGAIVGYLL